MLKALPLIAVFFIIHPASLGAQDFRVVAVDLGQWPVLRLTVVLPTPGRDPEAYSLKLGSDGQPLTAKGMVELDRTGPSHTLVALDTSYTLTPAHLKAVQKSLSRYAAGLGPGEQIALLGFNNSVNLATAFTADRDRFAADLNRLRLGGRKTELHRCLLHGINLLRQREGRRCLVVVSDGHDEGAGLTMEQVLQSASENGVQISVVGLTGLPTDKDGKHLAVIKNMAEESGGVYWAAAEAGEMEAGLHDLLVQQRPAVPEESEQLFQLVFDLGSAAAPSSELAAELNYASVTGQWVAEFSLSVPVSAQAASGLRPVPGDSHLALADGRQNLD